MDKTKILTAAFLATGVIIGLGLVAGRGKIIQGAVATGVILVGSTYAAQLAAKVPV